MGHAKTSGGTYLRTHGSIFADFALVECDDKAASAYIALWPVRQEV
jgi:hypothetical protein